ncbi:Large proline-rich protein BAG6 [Armadillidium nasatum]|uniref:Large proline-rich protein BAG6 n=1 Tax=Armadillidium nasatum TaxID=96803 RepID=A0A5N5T919_9CRUS|nr:Large proline-rich protein BAG6 [Armadillidium nasatum]
MRAPPPLSTRGGDRRANGTAASNDSNTGASGSPGAHFRQRMRANQGPSSSGVRLQQAKSMLDKAAEVIGRLEAGTASGISTAEQQQASSSQDSVPDEQPVASGSSNSGGEPMETSGTSTPAVNGKSSSSKSSDQPQEDSSENNTPQRQEEQQAVPQELEALYQEMDALNSMDPPMMEGGHLMTSIGNPIMGAISNSLQGGLFQAASAAFVSALSSMGSNPTSSSSNTTTTTSTSAPAISRTSSSTTATSSSSIASSTTVGSNSASLASSSQAGSSGSSEQSAPPSRSTEGSPSSGNHPLSGVRGITVRITNRGSQRSPAIRLEHPRCSVMVEVLDQYQDVQRRLQPFLQQYYRTMVDDRSYEEQNSRQLRDDQLVVWRVSSAMHYISHALHAISDIMIDLRRNPPRQLRARPFIIPQPALVQAQINVGPSSDAPSDRTRVQGRNSDNNNSNASNAEEFLIPGIGEVRSIPLNGSSTSASSFSIQTNASPARHTLLNIPEYLDDDNAGVVFMHVGPNDSDPIPSPPDFLRDIMSQLGMRIGSPGTTTSSTTASSSSGGTSSSPPSTPGVRRVLPVHNSQATGNSGTSTTNSTQTRVTPRAQQVHVTPLHVPGMGMTQFDPFLPCQSHHIRPVSVRRRRRPAAVQTAQTNQNAPQENEETDGQLNSSQQQSSSETQNSSSSNSANTNPNLPFVANILSDIMSGRNSEHQSEEEQQQEQMFAQLVRGVMSEITGSIGVQDDVTGSQGHPPATLQDFLEPFFGGGLLPGGERDSLFAHLFTTVSQSLSMGDLIRLFFGDSERLNRLFEPLQQFVRERILQGAEPSETSMDRAIDEIISDVNPHLIASAGIAAVHDGIDYVNTIHNFIRHRLHDIFNLILNHREQNTFGSVLISLLRHTVGEFVALSLHCFTDGAQGLERLVEGRVQAILSGMSPAIQAWSVNASIMQLRSMMSHLAITDDHIRRYIVSPDEGRRMGEARQNRMSPVIPVPGPRPAEESPAENSHEQDISHSNTSTVSGIEVMEVDELGGTEEITTSESGSSAVSNEERPHSVTVGSQSWHSAVPQEWIPVITRDVERQRRGVPDTHLSDAYLCGVPLKRRKIAAQSKPHGTVQQVLQDTLRQSLRTSGVNRSLVESVSNEVSTQLDSSFASHKKKKLFGQILLAWLILAPRAASSSRCIYDAQSMFLELMRFKKKKKVNIVTRPMEI